MDGTASILERPEILAPAGDMDSLVAALHAGADAVYFGLDRGFNARARASNFSVDGLPQLVARIHRANARAYLTLNTLIFEPELPAVAKIVAAAARAGIDALIVQDPAVALLAQRICPQLELHASTQMTISSAEGAEFARHLGITRVVLPRELSVDEIAQMMRGTTMETEVFVHGALCVSWSGQCLTSEAWGQRSANRGQCAQSCRMPYDLVVDGTRRELGDVAYLLSPKDLAGARAIPALMELGVRGLKIEGRQKGPVYVATAVEGYVRWRDALLTKVDRSISEAQFAKDLATMTLAYSRGFSDGFLAGSDHQNLVEGRFPKHRGVRLGTVLAVDGREVRIAPSTEREWTGGSALTERRAPIGTVRSPLESLGNTSESAVGPAAAPVRLERGLGVVFDAGNSEDENEPGGRIFDFREDGKDLILVFGRPGPDSSRVHPGNRVWITNDPRLDRRASTTGEPTGRHPLHLRVTGRLGEPLQLEGRVRELRATVTSAETLTHSVGAGLHRDLLAEKLGSVGGTPLRLASLEADLPTGLHLPVSGLKALRRRLVALLIEQIQRGPERTVQEAPPSPPRSPRRSDSPELRGPELVALCRNPAQLEAVIAAGLTTVELDWMEWVGLGPAVQRAKDAGLAVHIATLRVQKPGEEGFDRRLDGLQPQGVLVRHWGALEHLRNRPESERPELHGDFSLNVTNSMTAAHLFRLGLATVTASHDLDANQLTALLDATESHRVTIVLHHRIATFHTEHCVYSHLLSEGRDFRTCGRPCERHEVSLRDHLGRDHPIVVDAGCRNTVFNGDLQTCAPLVPDLLRRGVRRFRVEFVREDGDSAARVLSAYAELLAGRLSPSELAHRLGVRTQQGVSAGTMALLV